MIAIFTVGTFRPQVMISLTIFHVVCFLLPGSSVFLSLFDVTGIISQEFDVIVLSWPSCTFMTLWRGNF